MNQKSRENIPCQARNCTENLSGFCQGIPSIIYEEKTLLPDLDVYNSSKNKTMIEKWGCAHFKRRIDEIES